MKGTLLVATCTFWALQLTWPVFNPYFPTLYVTEAHPVSVGNVVPPLLGFLSLLSAHGLRKATTSLVRGSTLRDVTSLAFSYLTVLGHGIHLACVVVEDASEHVHPSVQALVYFLHERVSHNAFQLGFYGTMALLLWDEVGVATSIAANGRAGVKECGTCTVAVSALRLVGSALLGAFFSIFAAETSTQAVTVSFYVLCLTAVSFAARYLGIGGVWRLYAGSELLICGVLAQVALVGLIVMTGYYNFTFI
eukprot:Em0007g255a